MLIIVKKETTNIGETKKNVFDIKGAEHEHDEEEEKAKFCKVIAINRRKSETIRRK